jgi:hypothetical protein
MAYDGGVLPNSKLPLTNELRLIEPSLRSDADHQVFKTLKQVEEWQKQLLVLSVVLKFQKEIFVSTSEALKREFAKLNSMGVRHRDADEVVRLCDLINRLNAEGCIIISADAPPLMKPTMDEFNKRMQSASLDELVFNKHNITVQSAGGVKYYPSTELKQIIHAGMQTAIDLANKQRLGPRR